MTDTVHAAYDIWQEMRHYINTPDQQEAAETLLGILIDRDCELDDIREAFAGDSLMRRALADYLENSGDEDSDDYDEDDETY